MTIRNEIIDELLAMEPMDMLSDPRFRALSDDEREELFLTLVPEKGQLHEQDKRSPAVLEALRKSKFFWRGSDQPKYLLDLKKEMSKSETAELEYDSELLKTLAFLAATSDKYE